MPRYKLNEAVLRVKALEEENEELRALLGQARDWFISGWRHRRPFAYLRFRRRMNELLGIPPDLDWRDP